MKKIMLISLLSLSIIPAFAMDVDDSESPSSSQASQSYCQKIKKSFSRNKKALGKAALLSIFIWGFMSNVLNISYAANDSVTVQVGLPFNDTLPENANGCTYTFANDCDGVINEDVCEAYLEEPLANNQVIVGECEVEFLNKDNLGFGLVTAVSQLIYAIPFYRAVL